MKNWSKNIYVSTTKDGYYALDILLKNKKRIDEIISLPKAKAQYVSDYIDFKSLAKRYGIKITLTKNINLFTSRFEKERPNIIIVNGWSQLLKKQLLDTVINNCIGIHPALLPKNRGRAPIAWHFINQEKYGGVTLFYLEPSCDSGPIIDQAKFKIHPTDNASNYYEKITKLGAELLLKYFDSIADGSAISKTRPQDHSKATYLLKRRPKDSEIDFRIKTAKETHNMVRAVSDIYPLANFSYQGKKYFVLKSDLPKNTPTYSGIPGQIAEAGDDYVWILTQSRIIEFNIILGENRNKINIKKTFKVGEVANE